MLCNLCPRNCNALRTDASGAGVCKMPAQPVLARAGLHFWEEPPISGARGSGAIFFSGCALGCVFCQNGQISYENYGKQVSEDRLIEIFHELAQQGAHNLNFVSPTHFSHVILSALRRARPSIPTVYNTGGYDKVDTLRALQGHIDIYLPDLKYLNADVARRYSLAPDYPAVATAAIREMVRQVGRCEFDADGLLKKGVIIRHLMLPNQLAQTKAVLDWIASEFPRGSVLVSLMSQYVPWGDLRATPELARTLRQSEIRAAREYMRNLELTGFVQEGDAAQKKFTPVFDLTGV